MFVFSLHCLGWVRCGIPGEGSSVVGGGRGSRTRGRPYGELGVCDPSGGGSCFRERGGLPGVLVVLLTDGLEPNKASRPGVLPDFGILDGFVSLGWRVLIPVVDRIAQLTCWVA